MKRRVISIATALALCLSLCPTRALAADAEPDTGLCSHHRGHTEECGYVPGDDGAPCTFVCGVCPVENLIGRLPNSVTPDNKAQVEDQLNAILELYTGLTADEQDQLDLSRCFELQTQLDAANAPMLLGDDTFKQTANVNASASYPVTEALLYDMNGYTYTATKSTAMIVQGSGKLYLMGSGAITSKKGVGVEVLSGGFLRIEDTGLVITGSTYGLKAASGADVQLAGGTFTGQTAAIQVDNNDFSALLAPGCAYFDASGNPISTEALATAKTVVVKYQPSLSWPQPTCSLNYNGKPVDKTDLPEVLITARDSDDLSGLLQYSYRKAGDADFTEGLPTNAGNYEIKASLPQQETYRAAETTTYLTLTINPLQALITPPKAISLTYNGAAQQLVTAGEAQGGTVIEFAQAQNGPYSTDIPTAVTAGSHNVWYRVTGNENYTGQPATQVSGVRIELKTITPTVELSSYTFLYDGGLKEPTVTVKDGQAVVPNTEYNVAYTNNRDVGTATVKVTNRTPGNYTINTVAVTFKITNANQDALSITDKPDTVTYGDRFTLGTSGGSGSGKVTWSITSGAGVATVDANSGQVTVTGVGSATIKATKSGADNGVTNYEDATAVWTFTADKKPVTATVTADSKTYDGNKSAEVHAVVEQGIVSGDEITITGLTGTFSDENAGTNKTVTIDFTGKQINGKNSGNYTVTYSGTTTTADITKAAAGMKTAPALKALTYNGTMQELVGAGEADIAGILLEYALGENGPYSTAIPKAADAGSYEVWYRVPETGNYTGTAAEKIDVMIDKQTVNSPVAITLAPDSYEFDGTAKEPSVTVYGNNGNPIAASEYTVAYSNHINAGTAKVTVTAKADGNYKFDTATNRVEAEFQITQKTAQVITAPKPAADPLTFNANAQELVTAGMASGGTMVYSVGNQNSFSETIPTRTNAGVYTVYYKVQGDPNHADSPIGSTEVTISPKTVNAPVIELSDPDDPQFANNGSYVYDGSLKTPAVVVKDGRTVLVENTDYKVTYLNNKNAGRATVNLTDSGSGNYIVSGSTTFEITKAKAEFTAGAEPEAKTQLAYDGTAQQLVSAGASQDGTVVYSLNGGAYSPVIPTGTERGSYTVLAKVQGDPNHEDSEVKTIPVTIGVNKVTRPTVELSSSNFTYTGSEQKPTITVKDNNGKVIPADEYDVAYIGDTINAGSYTIEITGREANYSFTATASVTILEAGQAVLAITGKPNVVHYGDMIQLGTTGGSGDGTVTWNIVSGSAALGGSEGQFQITGTGPVTVKATRTPPTGSNYKTVEDTWQFYAYPKPVTAVVTASDKEYDGTDKAELTVTIDSRDLVDTDRITISNVTGTFDSENVGTNKTVTINHDLANVTGGENYEITYPATTTASITPKPASVTGVDPNGTLTYNGKPQELVTSGTAEGGDVAYSLDGINYSRNIPKGTDAGKYTVWYKALAGENYKDSAPASVDVTINASKVENPVVTCSPDNYQFDGTEKTPAVIVTYGAGNIIPDSEYTVTFTPNRIAAGEYTVTVTDKPDGNYEFASPITGVFHIVLANQNPLTITGKPANVCYGDTFSLSASGGSGSGAIRWSIEGTNVAAISNDGVVTVTGVGEFTVKAYRAADDSYNQSNTDSVQFSANKKPITPTVTAANKNYDGTIEANLTAAWKNGDLVGGDAITVTVTGEFATADVGESKQVVNLTYHAEGDTEKYEIRYPDSTTASIYKVDAKLDQKPSPVSTLTYTGSEQALVTAGTTMNGIGVIEYSLSEKGPYSATVPKAVNADTYTVWYRVSDSVNYTGITPAPAGEVTIAKAPTDIDTPPTASAIPAGQPLSQSELNGGEAKDGVPGSFAWTDGTVIPEDGTSYEVTFTPKDSANYEPCTILVPVTVQQDTGDGTGTDSGDNNTGDGGGTDGGDNNTGDGTNGGDNNTGNGDSNTGNNNTGNSGSSNAGSGTSSSPAAHAPSTVNTASASMQTSVQNGTATTVVSTAAGDKLVQEAVANQSKALVIKPEINSDVTKAEVSIPASTVSRLKNETSADLTVSTPVADVTIPNAALDTLSSAGGAVKVVTEQTGNAVSLALTAGGQNVESVPGGLTLTVPVEDAAPGTVAILVHNDGTRETIRKAVPENGTLSVLLDGPATVEIVDNSKEFTDVSSTGWAADAVAFASAHELFNGTSETTFSPNQPMSRGMLATVLYNLEGRPAQGLTSEFSDVSSDAWYAEGVSWATENGITNGLSDGQFGPNDSVTREQFAVMLWRYAGSPAADGQALDFTDADQASDYAIEALRWATANGILNGYGNGQLNPGGLATRAEAAQMLKNFMENT